MIRKLIFVVFVLFGLSLQAQTETPINDSIKRVNLLKEKFSTQGGLVSWFGILFTAGFTPLPFKLFTITSGIINFNIFVFFFVCLFARGLRFFIVAYFSSKFGKAFSVILLRKIGIIRKDYVKTESHLQKVIIYLKLVTKMAFQLPQTLVSSGLSWQSAALNSREHSDEKRK